MRQSQILLINDGIPDHDQIHIQGTRPPASAVASPAKGVLGGECPLHQGCWLECGFGDHHDIEKQRTLRWATYRLGLVHRRDIHHNHIGSVSESIDGTLYVAESLAKIRTDGVDDLAQRFHTAQGVCVNGMRIGTTHVVLLLVSVTATSATSTGIGACGLCTVTSTHWMAS